MKRRNFTAEGDYALNSTIEQTPATAQAVTTRLRLFQGEWFLNTASGVPWFQDILVKPARLSETEQIIRSTIEQTEGIKEITSFTMTFDASTRKLIVTFTATTIYGDDFTEVIGLSPTGA